MGWLLHYEKKEEYGNKRPVEYVVLLDKEEVTDEDIAEWLKEEFDFSRKLEVRGDDMCLLPLEEALVPE